MSNLSILKRNLWIMTGVASIPFALLAGYNHSQVTFPHIYFVFLAAIAFNGFLVPFVLFRKEPYWVTKILAIGINLLIATLWIKYTGSSDSIFFTSIYFLPIIAATMYCGLLDSMITAITASALSVMLLLLDKNSLTDINPGMLVDFVLFFLVAALIGLLMQIEKGQHERNQQIADELELAYRQLSLSHEQLQGYTEIIEKMNKEMEQLAITDELTMLYNYRFFQVTLDKEINRTHRQGTLSLIMLDIDHFKNYNDSYGHLMGNQVLAGIARIMLESVRGMDTVVRYGGEEFSVILPQTEIEEARQVAERIRLAVENHVFVTEQGQETKVTVSLGIACLPQHAQTKSELISRADLALYKAKQTGRNRVCFYEVDQSA